MQIEDSIFRQLDAIVPAATVQKNQIRDLWISFNISPESDELEECLRLARDLEAKLRKVARSLQEKAEGEK